MKYAFGNFFLCSKTEKLLDISNTPVKIEYQQFSLLLLFLENPKQVLTREQLVARVWAGRATSDEAIRVALKKLRDILHDNSKQPEFIKTVPKQGYKWISDVKVIQNEPAKLNTLALWLSASILILFIASVLWWFLKEPPNSEHSSSYQIQNMTDLTGSEVYADYHHPSGKLAFLYRENKGDPQQIYIKNVITNETVRFSWDNENYSNVSWSPDGSKLAFTRYSSTHNISYVAYFTPNHTLQKLVTFDAESLSNKSVDGWLNNGESLLLSDKFTHGKNHSIYSFNINSQELKAISFPNTSGRGDYLAKQSSNGSYFAILRESEPGKVNLVVVDATNGDAIAQHALNFTPSFISWSENSEEVSLSSFYGEHIRYHIAKKAVSYLPVLPHNALDIFSHCGENCYVLRMHNGDFLDVQEKPLDQIFDTNNNDTTINIGRLFKRPGAQDFPLYMPESDSVLVASLQNSTLNIEKITKGKSRVVANLDSTYQLSNLAISQNGNMLAGSVGNRVFISPIKQTSSHAFDFVTGTLEQATNPTWGNNAHTLYFAVYINKIPTIFSVDTNTGSRREIVKNAVAFKMLEDDENKALVISPTLTASIYEYTKNSWKKTYDIGKLQSAHVNRWKLLDNYLYYTKANQRESYLCRIFWGAPNTQHECKSIGQNRFRLHFDINPTTRRIMLVESLSAQSNIIKLQW